MLHHGKHLKGYIDNVNRLVKDEPELIGENLETIVKESVFIKITILSPYLEFNIYLYLLIFFGVCLMKFEKYIPCFLFGFRKV